MNETPVNIFDDIPLSLPEELFQTILAGSSFKMERIVSDGHVTPEEGWYDQDWHEWVMLVRGSAELLFEEDRSVILMPGDHLVIPAHTKHRVLRTDSAQKTIWLVVHYHE